MLLVNDLSRHTRALRGEIDDAVKAVLDRSAFVLGSEVQAFEHEFASYCGKRHCVSLANGTDAIELALRACEIGPGDSVITTANAGLYSTCAIRLVGATPVYVDVDPRSGLMCPSALEETCRRFRPNAIIATHLWGQMVDMAAVSALAAARGARLIEDCAQAHGARREGRSAGAWGDVGCFSFYPTKNLGALGDAGAAVTSSDQLAQTLRTLRQYGWAQKYKADVANGRNSRMDEVQAAILRCFLPKLDGWNERRRQIAATYGRLISNPRVDSLAGSGQSYVAHLYVVRSDDRESLKRHLASRDIASDVHYPVPDHLQECNRSGWESIGLPTTERLSAEVLTLPCFPELTDSEAESVARAVNEWS